MSLEVENDIIRINNQLCDFSKDGTFFAIAYQSNLIIKSNKKFDTIHSFIFPDIIEYLEWSRNSEYILCANIKKAIIQVYSIHYPEWKYKLIEGSAGLESVNWSPDSKYILTLSDFNKLICGHLNSIDGICWSPNSELLCIWSSFSDETKLIIYSTIFERDIAVFYPAQFQNLKGIENVTWMPSGQLLAVTGFNEMIVLLNHVTWKPLLHLYLEPIIKENYLNKVYEERIIQLNFSNKSTNYYNKYILEEKSERPINIKIGRKNNIERLSIAKFDILEFSSCGQYLAIKHQLYPTTLWIWNIIDDYLDYLLLENAIVAAKWNPTRAHLLIFCECVRIFEWTPHNANCISSPRNITILDARWHPQGNFLLLCGYNKAIIYQIENK
ncbi:WD repeat-containing protein WRAP73 isoform X3 [Apis mellifera]|uniref:WD repeat-containing protein WRAP73 isoform X3 n=1 Tax=Apis mellifera TaxID=7460 RepID=A0A7M7SQI3_APIME|nr:WD repeat-containing protein WRAP73 isoform X3 [Apis mellifera]|eukprot:XP_026299063.1 WD repeat-containing protein WRAP73 isoform X3 [Apis mellifera]